MELQLKELKDANMRLQTQKLEAMNSKGAYENPDYNQTRRTSPLRHRFNPLSVPEPNVPANNLIGDGDDLSQRYSTVNRVFQTDRIEVQNDFKSQFASTMKVESNKLGIKEAIEKEDVDKIPIREQQKDGGVTQQAFPPSNELREGNQSQNISFSISQ